jgi:hypothetical protein
VAPSSLAFMVICRRLVRKSDCCLGVMGVRNGWQPPPTVCGTFPTGFLQKGEKCQIFKKGSVAGMCPLFYFDGGAASYFGTALLATIITVFTLGIFLPYAIVLRQRWVSKHTFVEGRRLMFTGSGIGLFGNWIKWWLLIIVTIGIYSFWVTPRLTKWKVEHQAFDPRG